MHCRDLLAELDYSNTKTSSHNDTLVFVGDLAAKGGVQNSVKTIDYIRSLDAWAVRGNHDQDIINWRNWMAQVEAAQGLTSNDLEAMATSPEGTPEALRHRWRDEHFQIAKALSKESFAWLSQRSLTLHVRSLHAYIVHAGLLPWTIPKGMGKGKGKGDVSTNNEGPIEIPQSVFDDALNLDEASSLVESASASAFVPLDTPSQQGRNKVDSELAILTVPLNRKPYTLLNMRSVLKNGAVTKSAKKGWPWAPIWNQVMAACQITLNGQSNPVGGRSSTTRGDEADASSMKPNQCRPLNVM